MTNLTSMRARDLIAIATSAKTVAEIDPIVAEFERRMEKRAHKAQETAGTKGHAANASILGHVATNLAAVQEARAKLVAPAKPAKPAKAKPAAVDPVYAFLAGLTEAQRAALKLAITK